jgi:hypothetical protein
VAGVHGPEDDAAERVERLATLPQHSDKKANDEQREECVQRRAACMSRAFYASERAQEGDQIGFLLRREDEAEADFVETNRLQQRPS